MAGRRLRHHCPSGVLCCRHFFQGDRRLKFLALRCVALLAAAVPTGAQAGELFGGVYVHDVKLPTNLSGLESGMDLALGYRGGRIGKTPLEPYVFAAVNTAGETSYAAAGISARFSLGKSVYVRPGVGIAIHN